MFNTSSSSGRKLHLDLSAVSKADKQDKQAMASPNARTVQESQAGGPDTFGQVNQHPKGDEAGFQVGVSVDRNKKCRRTMEE